MSKPNETAVQRRWDWDYPIMARAEGIYLWDTEGRRYIDGSGGSSVVTSIGHGVKEVPAAIARQAEDFVFYPAHAFSNAKLLELCDLITSTRCHPPPCLAARLRRARSIRMRRIASAAAAKKWARLANGAWGSVPVSRNQAS